MSEYQIPAAGWTTALADALNAASPGDAVIVRTEAMRALAERTARYRGKAGVTIRVSEEVMSDD